VLHGLWWHGRHFTVAVGLTDTTVSLQGGAPLPLLIGSGLRVVTVGHGVTIATRRPDLVPTGDVARCGVASASSFQPGAPPLDRYVRITVGTPAERRKLAERFPDRVSRMVLMGAPADGKQELWGLQVRGRGRAQRWRWPLVGREGLTVFLQNIFRAGPARDAVFPLPDADLAVALRQFERSMIERGYTAFGWYGETDAFIDEHQRAGRHHRKQRRELIGCSGLHDGTNAILLQDVVYHFRFGRR